MPYQVTSGTTRKDLLTALESFAATNGWTTEYDDISASGELALSQLNCNFAVSDVGVTARSDLINGGTVDDGLLNAGIASSITPTNHHYYGHPDSMVSGSGDIDRLQFNDLTGPFSNIYFFTDSASSSTYIHCVIQSSTSRYSFISLGNLNKLGMSHDDVGYSCGEFYTWWNNAADYSANASFGPNYLDYTGHRFGVFGGDINAHLYIPDGVLDTGLGFPSGDLQVNGYGVYDSRVMRTLDLTQEFGGSEIGCLLDHAHLIQNDSTTGGAPLWPLPMVYGYAPAEIRCVLGVLPDVCLVNISGFSPGEVVTYGSEDWQLFPLKAVGQSANRNYGATPQPGVNTEFYALAIKRIT